MAFAITQSCCSDASCVAVCPVNCIHPTPEEPDFATAEMLYIDPGTCIDCGACADACPVDAIFPVDLLTGGDEVYADVNRDHYPVSEDDWTTRWSPPHFPAALTPDAADLRVAVVGTGPAASYTAAELLTTSARVTMLERLPIAGGLIRFGVAPDHPSTRAIGGRFATLLRNPRLTMELGVEVGRDVTHAELLAHHDAVVYAVGASADRTLGVPGEDLPGSISARTFVGWYNGHPESRSDAVDLSEALERGAGRVVIVGNGNVALDAARILLTDPKHLAHTDIAPHALSALRQGSVRDVVLVARRGPDRAAYSLAELRPLLKRDDLDVVVDGDPDLAAAIADAALDERAAVLRDVPVQPVEWSRPHTGERRRLVLRFDAVVERVLGDERVEGVCVRPTSGGTAVEVPTGLLLRSVGYRSEPLVDLPFDDITNTVPHRAGRVVDPATGERVPATYVVGWVKRGPSGGIGSNRGDAAETVASLVADANAGVLSAGRGSTRGFQRLLRRRRRATA